MRLSGLMPRLYSNRIHAQREKYSDGIRQKQNVPVDDWPVETLGSKLRKIRNALGLNQAEMAKRIGVEQPSISRYEKNTSVPDDNVLSKYSSLSGHSLSELRYGKSTRGSRRVKVVGHVGAGEAVMPIDDHAKGAGESAPFPEGISPTESLVAVRIKGQSMRPLRDGWTLYYTRDQDQGVPDDCLNQLCVVGLEDGQILVKELRRGYQKNRFNLHSCTAGVEVKEDQHVVWAAKVLSIRPA